MVRLVFRFDADVPDVISSPVGSQSESAASDAPSNHHIE